MWAQCPGIIEAVGQTWLRTMPLISEHFLKSQPGNALAWAPLPWGAGRDTGRGPPGSPDKQQLLSSPGPGLQSWGLGHLLSPPKLSLPLPWSPWPGLRLLKRLQPLCDLILLLFSSAPLWGPARPPKKPRPAPGDREPCGVGGRDSVPSAGAGLAPLGFLRRRSRRRGSPK